jgi:hypothetical protein
MKRLFRLFLIVTVISLVTLNLYVPVSAQEEKWPKDDPNTDEYNMADLFIARPMGFAAGIIGTGLFILSLPFTIPTRSVDEAAQMLVVKPFKFSFERKFPDDDM